MPLNPLDDLAEELDEQAPVPQAPAAPPADPADAYVQMFRSQEGIKAARLRSAYGETQDVTPDRAVSAEQIGRKLGLPPALVMRDYDALRKRAELADVPIVQITYESMHLANTLDANPELIPQVKDDLQNLGFLEWLVSGSIGKAKAQGDAQLEVSRLRFESMFRTLTAAEQTQLGTARTGMTAGGELGAADSWFRGAITGSAKLLPTWIGGLVEGSKLGIPAAVTAGTGAALLGQAGPQFLTPEEIITVPAATAAGFTAGSLTGAAAFGFRMEAGLAFDEFTDPQTRDEFGKTIDPDVAKGAALAAGALAGGLEAFGLARLARSIPGVNKLVGLAGRQAMKQVLKNATLRAAIGDVVKSYGKTLTAEASVEAAQRIVTLAAGEIARAASGVQLTPGKDLAADVGQEFMGAVQSMALLSLPGPAAQFAVDARKASRAKGNVEFFSALGEGVSQSKTTARMPEVARKLIADAVKDGPIETVYAPVDTWTSYWQAQGADPRELATAVTGSSDAYDLAIRTGADLPIPLARYAMKVAGTEHNAFFAAELRLGDPEAMNQRESVTFAEVQQEQARQTASAAAKAEADVSPIEADITAQALQAGVMADPAKRYGQQAAAVFGSLASRATLAGVDADSLFGRYGLTVGREAFKEQAKAKASPKVDKPGAKGTGPAVAPAAPGAAQAPGGVQPAAEAAIAQPDQASPEAGGVEAASEEAIPAPGQEAAPVVEAPPTREGIDLAVRGMLADLQDPEPEVTLADRGDESNSQVNTQEPEPAGRIAEAQSGDRPANADSQLANAARRGPRTPRSVQEGSEPRGADEVPAGQRERFDTLLAGARTLGFPGTDDQLADLFLDAVADARQIANEMAMSDEDVASGRDLLMAIAQGGGLGIEAEGGSDGKAGMAGEMETMIDNLLKTGGGKIKRGARAARGGRVQQMPRGMTHKIAGLPGTRGTPAVPGIVRRKDGMSFDYMREHINQDSRWADKFESLSEFVEAVNYAILVEIGVASEDSQTAIGLDSILKGALGVTPESDWWAEGPTDIEINPADAGPFEVNDQKEEAARAASMRAAGETFVVYDAAGIRHERGNLHGAQFYVPQPGEAFGKEGPNGFELLSGDGTHYPKTTNLLEAWGISEAELEGDITGGVTLDLGNLDPFTELNQGLFDLLEDPTVPVDRLTTGELQPRLPGDVGAVREQEVADAKIDLPEQEFQLTSPEETQASQTTLFQPVYHGSPHVFDKFSLHAMGTGEGAQVYGWGLYFASRREVAEYYRKALVNTRDYTVEGGGKLPDWIGLQLASQDVPRGTGTWDRRLDEFLADFRQRVIDARASVANKEQGWWNTAGNIAGLEDTVESLERVKAGAAISKPGRLYTVEIPSDEKFLDYDKPFEAQDPAVQDALREGGLDPGDATLGHHGAAALDLLVVDVRRDVIAQGGTEADATEAERLVRIMTTNPESLMHTEESQENWEALQIGLLKRSHVVDLNRMHDIADYGIDESYVDHVTDEQVEARRADVGDQGNEIDRDEIHRNVRASLGLDPDSRQMVRLDPSDRTGEGIYNQLARDLAMKGDQGVAAEEKASKRLLELGIVGIKFLDGGSRLAGNGSSNYVVFDDSQVQITQFDQKVGDTLTADSLTAFAEELKAKHGADLVELTLRLKSSGDIDLETIAVARGANRAGLGSKVLADITQFADKFGARITLGLAKAGYQPTESSATTTSRNRLVKFYKRFGFVENEGRHKDFSTSASMYREPTIKAGREGLKLRGEQSAALQAQPDSSGPHVEALADLLERQSLAPEGDGGVGAPSLVRMVRQVRSAAREDPEVFVAIVRAVPVAMVNDLFGSEGAAEEALRNDPVFQDRAAVDAELPVALPVDATSPVGFLLSEAARLTAQHAARATDARGEASKGRTTERAGQRDSFRQEKRGAIRFGPDRQFNIALFEKANLTTFLHESGHFYLEVYGDVVDAVRAVPVEQRNATQQKLLTDYNVLLKWMGVTSRAGIGVEQHETFARGFEAYLMEGKAPSIELREAFGKFRAWLEGVYRSLRALNVTLTPEVRNVMNRMLATDEAILRAEQDGNMAPMFLTAEAAGISAERFERYRAALTKQSQAAHDDLDKRLMREVQREREAAWTTRRDEIEAEVTAEVHARPVYVAIAAMQRGETPAGDPMIEGREPEPFKLSRKLLVQQFGKERLKRLPRPYIYTATEGYDPDQVAQMFGYASADELLTAVEEAPTMAAVIEQQTNQRMLAEHGSILLDGSLHEEAKAALSTEARDEVLREELRILGGLRAIARPHIKAGDEALRAEKNERAYERRWFAAEAALKRETDKLKIRQLQAEVSSYRRKARGGPRAILAAVPSDSVIRNTAKAVVGRMRVRELKPGVYWRAAKAAAERAIVSAARLDFESAIVAKQQELMNLALFRESTRAIEEAEKQVRRAKDYGKPAARERLGKAGHTYLDQIDGILDRFSFARVSQKALDRRAGLVAFLAGLEANNMPADMPAYVLDEARRTPYQELTVDELTGVVEGLDQLAHLARLKNKLLRDKEARELSEITSSLVDSIVTHAAGHRPPAAVDRDRSAKGERRRMVGSFFAGLRKIASLARQMDGGKDGGLMWEHIIRPLNAAADHEAVLNAAAITKLDALVNSSYPGAAKARLYDKLHIPATGQSLSKMQRVMIALNWGNEGNRDRIRLGEKWTDEQVQAVLDTLDAADWTFVQGVWSQIDSYWPEIAAKQERVYGVAPEKVEASSFETRFGTMRGGYFPLKYDDRSEPKAGTFAELQAAAEGKAAAYVNSTTRRGHTQARAEKVKLKLRLDFGVIDQHLTQVIHDLSHHEVLLDVGRVLGDSAVQRAIYDTQGDLVYKQFKAAIKDIAIGVVQAQDGFEQVINHVRTGAVIAGLGWSLTTALLQPLGLTQSIYRIGPKWVAKGATRWLRNPLAMVETVRWIHSVSAFMRLRSQTQMREINEIRQTVGIDTGKVGAWVDAGLRGLTLDHITRRGVQDSYFFLIAKLQMVADIPTWLGAYEKAMAAEANEERAVALADQAVIDAQGSGQLKDLAAVQRGGAYQKIWTTFYSFFSVTHNLLVEAGHRTKFSHPAHLGRLAADFALLISVPAVLGKLIKDAAKGEEDDEDQATALLGESAAYLMGTLPGLREFSGVVAGYGGWTGPAGARAFSNLGRFAQQAGQAEFDEAFWRTLNDSAGVVFHFPSGQSWRTIQGIIALSEGRTSNPGVLITGPPRDE